MSTRPYRNEDTFRDDSELSGPGAPADDLLLGLQLCRASTMSLTRLQLALRSGDRYCALDAIDRLHAIDCGFERLVERLPGSANENPELQSLARHLEDQKIAIAFEKLALASEVSGPDLVSGTPAWRQAEDDPRERPVIAFPEGFLAERQIPVRKIYWALLAIAGMILAAVAVTLVTIAG